MAWCRQATSHYLNQCWLSSMTHMASLGDNILSHSNFPKKIVPINSPYLSLTGELWGVMCAPHLIYVQPWLLQYCITETYTSSCWRHFHHWLHQKLSFWQLPVQPVKKISSTWGHFHFSDLIILCYFEGHFIRALDCTNQGLCENCVQFISPWQ